MNIPLVGLGTWRLCDKECTDTVKAALDIGYKHIDTATVYDNHKAIGKALVDFDRSSIFITSKIHSADLYDENGKSIRSTADVCATICQDLGTSYIDLVLLHNPDIDIEVLKDMVPLVEQKVVHNIGVSNFGLQKLKEAVDSGVPIAANQIELHVPVSSTQITGRQLLLEPDEQVKVVDYCQHNNIKIIAHRPLAKGLLANDNRLHEIGKKYNKSAAQIALRWLVQQGFAIIPKSKAIDRLRENCDIFNFQLTSDEMIFLSRTI